MTRRRRRIGQTRSTLREPMYTPPPDLALDAARRAYMNSPEFWHHVWAEDKERA